MFLDFLKANVPGIENAIDLKTWTEGTGIPPDAMEPVSAIYTKIVSLAHEFKQGRMPSEEEVANWHGQEWELYLENLPKSVEASQVWLYVKYGQCGRFKSLLLFCCRNFFLRIRLANCMTPCDICF
jgi:hypothetical protein